MIQYLLPCDYAVAISICCYCVPLPFSSGFPISNVACPVKANCFHFTYYWTCAVAIFDRHSCCKVTSLCSRCFQARELSKEATDHFLKLKSSISANDQWVWEKEIRQAKSCHLTMPESMDILGARKLSDAHEVKRHLIRHHWKIGFKWQLIWRKSSKSYLCNWNNDKIINKS